MQRAFSLVELSIVLVILGLLVGSVLAGQSLIRAAELRSVTTQIDKYRAAAHTFRDKYFALPGDMANATQFWGELDPAIATCAATATTSGTATCNGDGNGRIRYDAAPSSGAYFSETYRFWQHLANAGLIEGSYTGVGTGLTATDVGTVAGINSPKSAISNAAWWVSYDQSSGLGMYPAALPRNNFRVGGTTTTSWPAGKLFTPTELWSIDTKLDDGKPALGIVTAPISSYPALPDCTTSDATTAEYELTITSKECMGYFAVGL